jgi:hypothetical protein
MTEGDIFAFSDRAAVHVETVFQGCQVLVVDDVFADPEAVRALALTRKFDSTLAFYPGVHGEIDKALLRPLFLRLATLLERVTGMRPDVADFSSDFSLVTTPAKDMLANQKHPHVDGLPLAGVVYLSPHLSTGTSFFRHGPTGYAMLRTEEEASIYNAWLETEGARLQPDTYAVADGACWHHLHTIEGRYNRLVMYPGIAFHSIAMVDVDPEVTLETARLTQRIFLSRLAAPA